MTEAERPSGPYWRSLLAGRAVPKVDLGPLIRERFRAKAAQILHRDFDLPLSTEGWPDTAELSPERFEADLGALVGSFTLAYIDTVRDVFVDKLREALGGAAAEPDGADEWQVGCLNVYPDEGWQLEMIAEELHDALLPFGPIEGSFRLEVGTIAGRVWSALTDDLGITMAHPAYRDGVFDPKLFARIMERQFLDTGTMNSLMTLTASLQKFVEVMEGEEALANLKWPKTGRRGPVSFDGLPWLAEAIAAGRVAAPHSEPSASVPEPVPSPSEASSPAHPAGQAKPAAESDSEPAVPSGDLQNFFGRLFGSADPSEADDDRE